MKEIGLQDKHGEEIRVGDVVRFYYDCILGYSDVPDESYTKQPDISPVSKLYRNSLSAFLSPEGPVKTKIRYNKYAASSIEDLLSPLESVAISQVNENQFEAEFLIDDLRYLCKQLFSYGKNVEILSPPEARQEMLRMLKESLAVYESGK